MLEKMRKLIKLKITNWKNYSYNNDRLILINHPWLKTYSINEKNRIISQRKDSFGPAYSDQYDNYFLLDNSGREYIDLLKSVNEYNYKAMLDNQFNNKFKELIDEKEEL